VSAQDLWCGHASGARAAWTRERLSHDKGVLTKNYSLLSAPILGRDAEHVSRSERRAASNSPRSELPAACRGLSRSIAVDLTQFQPGQPVGLASRTDGSVANHSAIGSWKAVKQ
jgi:hypothetical protein